jgi:hypothetical protein
MSCRQELAGTVINYIVRFEWMSKVELRAVIIDRISLGTSSGLLLLIEMSSLMNTTQTIIGFDARIDWTTAQSDVLVSKRLAEIRPRLHSSFPCSTDVLIWPTVFETEEAIELTASQRQGLLLEGRIPPKWIGPNRPLWSELHRLREALFKTQLQPVSGYVEIAVTWLTQGDARNEYRDGGPYIDEEVSPTVLDSSWTLLGYDVSDGSLESVLFGLALHGTLINYHRVSKWRAVMNEHSLFRDSGEALDFRDLLERHPEPRNPLHVFGLWSIQTIQR